MHRNDKRNQDDHHLYGIFDKEREGLYKYGICGRPLNKDGSSPRANEQVKLFNRVVGWARFFAKVLLTKINGRAKADNIEDEHVEAYEKKHGHKPPGNL